MTDKKQIIYPVVALVLGGLIFVLVSNLKQAPATKPEKSVSPLVNVAPITVQSLQIAVDSHGVVEPKYRTRLVAQVSGEIVFLAPEFVVGGFVRKGQLLARIDPSDYQALVTEAAASLASAEAALELEQAQGKVAAAEWRNISDQTPTGLSLRKPQLAQEQARVSAARAEVTRAQRNLERTRIVAPYDALIQAREISLGSYVSSATELGIVQGVEVAEVRLPIADSQLQFLQQQGRNSAVTLLADFSGQPAQWQATVVRSEGVIDKTSRMTYLVAEVKWPYGSAADGAGPPPLRFGTYVRAKVAGITLARASVIPRHLIENGRVAILDDERRLRYRDVTIIRQQGADAIVHGDVLSGDRLITTALDYPVEGMPLTPSAQLATEVPLDSEIAQGN